MDIIRKNILIIGGGAAGLMAAIAASEAGARDILIAEGSKRCGTKILMSGGTRCNVTNETVSENDFFGGSRNFIRNVFRAYDNTKTVEFFSRLGLGLKTEAGGKYFPDDDSAQSVLNALLRRVRELKVEILYSAKIERVSPSDEGFIIRSNNRQFIASRVIIAAGGRSYPTTGSDGSGYRIAENLGHTVIQPVPALTPVLLDDKGISSLSGITIPARLMLFSDNRKVAETQDSLLFTHFGLSGPAALNISREIARNQDRNISLKLSFIPDMTLETMVNHFKDLSKSQRSVLNILHEYLPKNVCLMITGKAGIDSSSRLSALNRQAVTALCRLVTEYPLNVTGLKGFRQAEVTAGGVSLDEIKYQTMESKKIKGLYFAGEILDVDGRIGGFNFQWAWSTGYIAGQAAGRGT